VPAIPNIAKELGATPAQAGCVSLSITSPFLLLICPDRLSVTISILGNAIGTLWWAAYSGFYGRRPIFLFSLPVLFVASLGVASARSITALLVWRVFQAFGCSSGMSVGASVIGDIYRLEERGTAMGIFFGVGLAMPPHRLVG
jgi:MFS family permease